MITRRLLLAAALCAPALACAATRITFEDGTILYADYLVRYWENPSAVTRGATPDEDAPGNIMRKPGRFGGKRQGPGFVEMQYKLETLASRVLEHPALANIRGSSLLWFASFGHERRGPVTHAIPARLALMAYPIRLADPETKRFPDGTFHSPGEAPSLVITVNDPDQLEDRQPVGTWQGMTVLRGGHMFALSNNGRPLYVAGPDGRMVVNPDLVDTARPRSDIQFMTVYVGMASHDASALAHRRIAPLGGIGRLVGAMYNSDWRALMQDANAAG
jgi:hypothetical protein